MRSIRRMMVALVVSAAAGGTGAALASTSLPTAASGAQTGLANAIAHVQANEAAHPNRGLANALSHLQANQAKNAAKRHGSH